MEREGLPELPPVEFAPHELPGLLVVRGARGAILAHWAKLGLAQVQDATAAGVVERMRIARRLARSGPLRGIGHQDDADSGEDRIRTAKFWRWIRPYSGRSIAAIAARSRDLQTSGSFTVQNFPKSAERFQDSFDRILIDVPCSNSGVLARRPEARYRVAVDCLEKDPTGNSRRYASPIGRAADS